MDQAGVASQLFGGRYAAARLIKSAAGVRTYLGVDQTDDAPVVIKAATAATVSLATRLRFEHEADVLRRLENGSSTSLIDAGREGDDLFLVQRFVPGVTLEERLRDGPLAVVEALSIASDVLRALEGAHDVGVVHRDVKPANVMLTEERAVLIDFGLARSAWLDGSLHDAAVGSARYMAPEQAGLIDVAPDERADLYSVGVVLFECLAGRPPFPGATVGEVLRQHLNDTPPALRGLGVSVPRAVDAVVERLLRKDPSERYQTASAILADISDVRRALESGVDEPALVPGAHDQRRTLTEPAFVGRAEELAALSDAVARARSGAGGLVVLEAESGGGKTRLLAELAEWAAGRGAWILRGQGVDQVGQRPFQVLEGVAEALLSAAEVEPSVADAVRARIGEDAEAVADALPELSGLLGQSPATDGGTPALGPEAYGETRSVHALPSLLSALGSEQRAAVVLLDDCQWADTVTARMLARWTEQSADAACHVVVVVAFRSEEVPPGHPLRDLKPSVSLALAPFSSDDVRRLAESMAGPLPIEAVSMVARLSEGSPFMASAVLRGLVESRALVDGPDGWQVDPVAMADVQTSRQAAAFLIRRLELLSEGGLRLLSVGAVLGKEFDLDLAIALADASPGEAVPALDEARRRRILWLDEQGVRCAFFFHDKLREALLARLDEEQRRHLHLRAAARIESIDRGRVFELAYHFDAAGEPERALPYALVAGEQARAQHSLEIAEVHYRIAARAAEEKDDATRARVSEGLGDVLTLRGAYGEAVKELARARALVTGRVAGAQLDGKLGDVAFKCGDVTNALRWLEQALRQLGRRVPRTSFGYLVALLRETVVQVLHTLLPRLFVGRRSLDGADEELLAIHVYSRLAYVHWFHSGRIPCGWAHLRELNLAERYPPTLELAQAYSEHAPVMTMVPWTARGIDYAERSLAIRKALGDVWGEGQSLHFHGVVLYAASRYRECIAKCREAVRLLERTGDRWEVNTAYWHIAFSLYRLGELRSAVELSRRIHDGATDIGDQAAAGISLSSWARASGGRVPAELIHAALEAGSADAHTATELHLAEAVRLLAEDRPDEAVAVLEAARAIVRRAGLRQEYVAPIAPWRATATRTCAERVSVYEPRRRRQAVRRARRAARGGVRVARSYPNNRPHALRELALVEAMRGRPGRARALFEASVATARAQGATFEEAQTRRARGAFGITQGWEDAESDLTRGEADVNALLADATRATSPSEFAETTLSLADRFATLLESGRKVAAAASEDAVYAAVTEAARTLLRGDRSEVIEVDERGDPVTDPSDSLGVSTTLLRRAVEARAPQVSGEELAGDAADSLVLSGARSALCAPIEVEGRVTACLYVTHRRVGGLFGTDEVQLAEFVSTLAGAALENAAGSEARFRSLAQNSSDVITIVSAEGCIEYLSSSVERVFGHDPSSLVGSSLREWVHPEDTGALLSFVEEAPRRVGGEALIACRLRHRDGTWRHAETTLNNLLHDPSVRGVVLNTRDVSERKELEDELRRRATHDALTGLPNRSLFTDRVEQAVARRRRVPAPLALLFLDLDDFKSVNDSLGHAAGDLVLRAVADRLSTCVRPGDTIARFGGDEFAILLDDAADAEAIRVAQRIIEAMRVPFDVLDHELNVRASIGVRTAAGDERAEDLLTSADVAMYTAKGRGKARYEVFRSEMRSAALERSSLKSALERALDRDELVLHYQPVVELESGRVVGVEALLRWQHSTRGLLAPAEFIALAEETGVIIPIGRWALRMACAQAREWQKELLRGAGFELSVNISARQLQHPSLTGDVAAALLSSGLDPHCLTLELTESAMVHDTELVLERLADLNELGIRLAVDDFGTGYSSLSYLHRLPFDVIKIDKSFIERMGASDEPTLAGAIVEIARSLRLDPVAEGIETAEQRDGLLAMGCEYGQGYYFCRPLPAEEVGALLGAGGISAGCS